MLEAVRDALIASRDKLKIMRKTSGDEYQGGMEYTALMSFIDDALRALEAHMGADGWQPIETVPRDRYVLLYSPEGVRWDGNMEVGQWFGGDEDHACFWSTGGPNGGLELGNPQSPGHYGYREPNEKYSPFTHWMDLPPDPPAALADATAGK